MALAAFSEYLRFFVTLTAVLDPFIAVPIFIGLTAQRSAAGRARLARAVTLTVFLVLAGAVVFGEPALELLGTSLAAFRVGGGLVLLLMSLAMLNAEVGGLRQSEAEAAELESRDVSGVVPLAVPLLAGPGAISTSILAAQAGGAGHAAVIIGCIGMVCALLWAMLALAQVIGRRMGTTGLNIATRILGLLLAAIAIETMAAGMKGLFPGLA